MILKPINLQKTRLPLFDYAAPVLPYKIRFAGKA
jgi:hypothetical protein